MVFLGGPTYSLSITLFSILFFSGLGSRFARRQDQNNRTLLWMLPLAIVFLIPATAAVFHFFIPHWLHLELPARVVLSVLIIAPAGFVMGMPFPLGIRILNESRPEWIPWAWATNSFMTVFGPLFCIFLSMRFGFQAVFFIASGIYLAGFLAFRPLVLYSRAPEAVEAAHALGS
jgi:hypothetical protein